MQKPSAARAIPRFARFARFEEVERGIGKIS
jgi:hypothetical protein